MASDLGDVFCLSQTRILICEMVVTFPIGLSSRKIKRLFAGVLKTIKYSVDLDAFFFFFLLPESPEFQ